LEKERTIVPNGWLSQSTKEKHGFCARFTVYPTNIAGVSTETMELSKGGVAEWTP
jgi:hypothetical protein